MGSLCPGGTLSQDPVDDPDGPENAKPGIQPTAEAALEPPPEAGEAELFQRRARLAEDRLAEVLAAYRKLRTENEGFRERITRNVERTLRPAHASGCCSSSSTSSTTSTARSRRRSRPTPATR